MTFQMMLGMANVAVALLNAIAYQSSDDNRDMIAAIAWSGSAFYWFWRAMLQL